MAYQLKPWIPEQMHQVFLPPGEEIVDYNHAVPPGNQPVNKVAPNKPRPSGNHDPQRGLAEADGHPPPSPAVRSIDIGRLSGNGEAAEEGEGGRRVGRMVVWVEERKKEEAMTAPTRTKRRRCSRMR
ncbi:hypothetical protein KSP39_PZI001384 [Platanthera zijinensis]|uniref:Uncharacterized protein n=1 Tax=Platanthera zijinensis TaxID=2320716 RepID=A0AAP0C1V7_9ASPA